MSIISLDNSPDRNLFARDLVCDLPACGPLKDKNLTFDDVADLISKKIVPDASFINPAHDTIVWASMYDDFPYKALWRDILNYPVATDSQNEVADFGPEPEFNYIDLRKTVLHRLSISVDQIDPATGQPQNYSIVLGSAAHNFLARKALLRKLGYFVPPVQYLPKLRLKFDSNLRVIKQSELIHQLNISTGLDPRNWLTNVEQTCPSTGCFYKVANSADVIEVQDVVILKGADDDFYNLARGIINHTNIRDRRVLNAAIIPFVLTDFVSLVNFVSWVPGRVYNHNLILPYEFGEEFSTSREDAQWITRRILQLNRNDFKEIIAAMHYPDEVSQILVEKLIARRNFLRRTLLPNEGHDLPFTTDINIGNTVIHGLLKKNVGMGLASVFYDQDTDNPKNPLSWSEIFAFIRSKSFSNIVSNAVSQFNTKVLPKTDVGFKIFNHQLDLTAKQFADFLVTGKPHRIPYGYYPFPYFDDNVIVSRDLVIGSFLGADNTIQLADTIGFQVGGGMYVRTDSMPSGESLAAKNKLYTTWTYTHLRPALSVKAAIKEPMTDIIVPLVRADSENVLKKLSAKTFSEAELKQISDLQKRYERHEQIMPLNNELQTKIDAGMAEFSNSLAAGDSLVITKYWGHSVEIDYTKGLSSILSAQARIFDDFKIIERIHFYRKDKTTMQIYRTPGHMNSLGLDLSLNMYLPICTVQLNRNCASVNSNFFSINIDSSLNKNPYILENLQSLLVALQQGTTEHLVSPATEAKPSLSYLPIQVYHQLCEKNFGLDLLAFDYEKQKISDDLKITPPTGPAARVVVETKGYRTGMNYEKFSLNAANALIQQYGDPNVQLSSQANGNPADTVYGHAFTKKASFETERDNNMSVAPFLNLNYQWRGWSLARKNLLKILGLMKTQWGIDFFRPEQIANIQKILLYNVSFDLNLYESGLYHMATLPEDQTRAIFNRSGQFWPRVTLASTTNGSQAARLDQERNDEFNARIVDNFIYNQHTYLKLINTDPHKAGKVALDMFNTAESILGAQGLFSLVGGFDNLMMQVTINGFKEGDPNGNTPIVSDSFGQIGASEPFGPSRFYMGVTNMNASEFNLFWLINKL